MSAVIDAFNRYASKIMGLLSAGYTALVTHAETGSWLRQRIKVVYVWSLGGIHGAPSTSGIPADDLGQTENIYIHFKLPFAPGTDFCCRLDIEGYQYGVGKIVRGQFFAGRIGATLSTHVQGTTAHSPGIYMDDNGYVVCRLFFSSAYVLNLTVSGMSADDATRTALNNITAKASLTSNLTF